MLCVEINKLLYVPAIQGRFLFATLPTPRVTEAEGISRLLFSSALANGIFFPRYEILRAPNALPKIF